MSRHKPIPLNKKSLPPERWRLPLPAKAQRLGRDLLDQQMWCWGCDVRRAEGNLLLHYGFTRQRPPEGKTGSSAYTFQDQTGHNLILWGFGLFYSEFERGNLFLKRYEFKPRLALASTLPTGAYMADQLPVCRSPHTAEEGHLAIHLLAAALHWLGAYERWVMETQGVSYRQGCIRSWHQKSVIRAEEIAATWLELARQCEESICSDEYISFF